MSDRFDERLERAFQIETVGVIFFRTDGRISEANDAFLQMVGYTRRDLATGVVLWDVLTPPDWMPRSLAALTELQSSGRTTPYEKQYFRKDGTRWWALCAARQISADEGVEYVVDITERKLAEEALRASEEKFRLLTANVRDHAIFMMDATGHIVSWNEGAERILAYTQDEVLGRRGSMFFTDEDRERGLFEEELQVAAETGSRTDENWLVRKGGGRFWASGTTNSLREDGGTLRGYTKIFRDLTEPKAAADALREKELRLRVALTAARMGTWHWDIAGNRQMIDENLQQLLGAEGEEAVTTLQGFLQLIHPEDRAATEQGFIRSVTRGEDLNVEFRVLQKDGRIRWLKDQGDVLYGNDGRPLFLTGACMDITELKETEQALHAANFRLAEADRKKDEFLGILAHELRNPLAPIRHAVSIARSSRASEAQVRRSLEIIDNQVQHMALLLDDLLDISRVTQGKVTLRKEFVDIATLVKSALESVNPTMSARNHVVRIDVPSEPIYIDVDPLRMSQVLSNLLTNAAKYTDAGGLISVAARKEGNAVVIRVTDSGIGISHDALPHLFEMFSQVQSTLGRSQGGLGIGLALSKGLVELHGGSISAESPGIGRGATFVVRLPAPMSVATADNAKGAGASLPQTASSRRVLVADDNTEAAEMLGVLLGLYGHEVRVAASGRDALQIADEFKPDVLLLDIGMPDLSGYDVAREVRGRPWGSRATIVAISGWAQEKDKARSFEAGMDHHLAKPVDPQKIQKLVCDAPQTPAE